MISVLSQRFGRVVFILGFITIALSSYRLLHGGDVDGKNTFIEKAISNGAGGPVDEAAIKNLCLRRTWKENAIFECQAPQDGGGGPVMIRNVVLNCVRYAIEAGAAFVIPQIISPKFDRHLQEVANSQVPFTHLFDQDHFVAALGSACPQLKIYNHTNELWELPSTAKSYTLTLDPPKDLFNFPTGIVPNSTIITQPSEFLPLFTKWFNRTSKFEDPELPVRVTLQAPFLQWPLTYDDPAFVSEFGKILNYRKDTKRLAAAVLYEMSKKFDWKFDLDNSTNGKDMRYVGVNLDIASTILDVKATNPAKPTGPANVVDASMDWGGYQRQAQAYTSQAALSGLDVVYVAGIESEQLKNFTGQLMPYNMKAVVKMDFLSATELAEMQLLTKDQQSLIDYEILLRSTEFVGGMASLSAWNIALARHGVAKKLPVERNRTDKSFRDPLSTVFGDAGICMVYEAAMWP